MTPEEILNHTRQLIREHASDDPDKLFYANRFVFARLQLDERRTKSTIKQELLDSNQPCHKCRKTFEARTGIHLHRLDGERGYSCDNCVLMHPDCHTQYHAEHPQSRRRRGRPRKSVIPDTEVVLTKKSKRYEGKTFLYWWDISPNLAEILSKYDAVEFLREDTGESCVLPPPALKGFLTAERQTSRGTGNWGIKVLAEHPDKLAFEPGTGGGQWTLLPVVWIGPDGK